MSELLDLKLQDEFSFRMSSLAEREQKEELQADCGRVVDLAKATVKDMCLLAWQLYQIKQKGHWESVINPKTGFAFFNNTFADFCDYAFGFSKTKTSDLLRISQFVNPVGEIEAGYQSYNTSQLVELASIAPSHRVYFNSDMSVAEMRVAKDYVKKSGEFFEEKKKVGFDLLTKAQEWKSSAKKSEPIKPDVMDGQMSLFSEENEETDDDGAGLRNPTSDLAELGEEIDAGNQSDKIVPMSEDYIEKARQAAHAAGLPFYEGDADEFDPYVFDGKMSVEDYKLMHKLRTEKVNEYDEQDEAQEDMRGEMATIEADAEMSVSEKYRFGARAHVRDFISDYQAWPGRCGHFFLSPCWCYSLKNGAVIYAMTYDSFIDFSENITTKRVLYFLQEKGSKNAIELSKEQFERWCSEHKQEL